MRVESKAIQVWLALLLGAIIPGRICAGQGDTEQGSVCASCTEHEICAPHQVQIRNDLPGYEDAYKFGAVEERIAAIEAIARLNWEHVNSPSRKVTTALTRGLSDLDLSVRLKAIEWTRVGQHRDVLVGEYSDALKLVRDDLDAWKDIPALRDDPSAEEIEAHRVVMMELAEHFRTQLSAHLGILKMLSMMGTPGDKRARKQQEAKLQKVEGLLGGLVEKTEELLRPCDAIEVGLALVKELGALPDDRSKLAVVRFYEMLLKRSPSRCLPVAHVLLGFGTRDSIELVTTSFAVYEKSMAKLEKRSEEIRPDRKAWGPKLHEVMVEYANSRGLEGAPEWGPKVSRQWRRWFKDHRSQFESRLGKISSN